MESIEHYHFIIGITIARVFLGFLFFFQGYDAIIRIGLGRVIDTYDVRFAQKGIPKWLTALAAIFTSYTELICGALLVIGLFEPVALYLLGANLIVAGIGFGMNEPLWDTRNVFLRLVLLLLLLLTPWEWHGCSVEQLFIK